jgi:hypothetical protein
MAETPRRIDIGFQGGLVLSVRVIDEVHSEFRKALSDSSSEHWFELKTQDSEVHIDLSQVVYVRLDTDEHRVGF